MCLYLGLVVDEKLLFIEPNKRCSTNQTECGILRCYSFVKIKKRANKCVGKGMSVRLKVNAA